ncbi:putative G-patch domain protein [Aspergillus ibericus CBS 121593]|uniref:G-patch domain-containing protein n=1 Tax=Aspergillus ibericus CBS 121593 TaxID=1448316 RepID=A0A395GXI2_9EURO|nr:hypothetical protein BO80DRAFT_426649 [Aspergillus ibericus CBS 121593]RAK99397.1 hypothetical protein BO80DRAFT_426649 [Aspergillus ibericus CBS 121593]
MPPTSHQSQDGADDEDEYILPLEDQRVFGAGIRRKRVPFVRSSEHELSTTTTTTRTSEGVPTSSGQSIADRYLSIVLDKGQSPQSQSHSGTPSPQPRSQSQPIPTATSTSSSTTSSAPSPSPNTEPQQQPSPDKPTTDIDICPICNLPTTTPSSSSNPHTHPHEATLPHQLSLPHSHPPSHLDRTRPGLRYLAAYGWDPDKRIGLGAPGREGIREPVKGKLKEDTVGLGAVVPEIKDKHKGKGRVEKLNAKEVRKKQMEERRKGERMREMFFRSEEVLRFFGEGA